MLRLVSAVLASGGVWGISARDGALKCSSGDSVPVVGQMFPEEQLAHDRTALEIERRMVAALEEVKRTRFQEGVEGAAASKQGEEGEIVTDIAEESIVEQSASDPPVSHAVGRVQEGLDAGSGAPECSPASESADNGSGACSASYAMAREQGAKVAAVATSEDRAPLASVKKDVSAEKTEAERLHEAAVAEEKSDEGDTGAALERALRLHGRAAELGHAGSLAEVGHMHAGRLLLPLTPLSLS